MRDAHKAAASGDVINLSGGAFQAITITKAVTLRGTGIDAQDPTYIVNTLYINIPTSDNGRLSMEGIRCGNAVYLRGTLTNAYFLKCLFQELGYYNSNVIIKNAMLADCKVLAFGMAGNSTYQFINSYVGSFYNGSNNTAASFINCVVREDDASGFSYSQMVNCVICSNYFSLPSSSVANNCVSVGNSDNIFSETPSSTGCKTVKSYADVFKTFTGTYSDTETFELTDAAKTNYLGTDGTQMGMYGGVLPYTSTPSYPQITKMNVANKTTADGKLSVEIEVSAAQ